MARRLWEGSTHWSSIDLHMTLLDLFGVKWTSRQGVSWWPYWSSMRRDAENAHQLRAIKHLKEMNTRLEMRSVLSLNWYTRALYIPQSGVKLIEDTRSKTLSMFSITQDPQERDNLCDRELKQCHLLRDHLRSIVSQHGGRQPINTSRAH